MSDFARLDLNERIARIENLQEEARKFAAEQRKLIAEATKLERERRLLPWSFLVALTTGVGIGLIQLAAHLAGWWH